MRSGIIAATAAGSLLLSGALTFPPATAAASVATVPTIHTIAGGDGGPGLATTVGVTPCAVTTGGGSVVFSDNSVLRSLNGSSDQLTNLAGVSAPGNVPGSPVKGAGGLATAVATCGITADASGNLVFGQTATHGVRVLAKSTGPAYGQSMTAGHVYTIAGTGVSGYTGDGGPALKAELNSPQSVAVDAAGNVVVADAGASRIRVIAARTGTYYGRAMTAGDIYSVYTGASGSDLAATAVDHYGNILIADPETQKLLVRATQSGTYYGRAMAAGGVYGVAPLPGFNGDLVSVTTDASGNVIFGNVDNLLVQVLAASTGSFYGQSMTTGHVYTIAGNGNEGYNGDGIPALSAYLFPEGVAVDSAGNVVIGQGSSGRLRVVATASGTFYGQSMTAGDVYQLPGSTGASALAIDASGNVLMASGSLTVLAATSGFFYNHWMNAGQTKQVTGVTNADSVALDKNGNVVLGFLGSGASGAVSVYAVQTGSFYGQAMTKYHEYRVAGNEKLGGALGNGGPALQALVEAPTDTVADASGNLVITDQQAEMVRVVAEKTGTFYGVNMTAGDIYAVAGTGATGSTGDGGSALRAEMNFPTGVSIDSTGNLVIADTQNSKIRVVAIKTGTFYNVAMTAGDIYTIAGTGTSAFGGDGGPAASAWLYRPSTVTVEPGGNLLVSDSDRIRQLTVG